MDGDRSSNALLRRTLSSMRSVRESSENVGPIPCVANSATSHVCTRSLAPSSSIGFPSSFFSNPTCPARCNRFAMRPTISLSTSAISSRNGRFRLRSYESPYVHEIEDRHRRGVLHHRHGPRDDAWVVTPGDDNLVGVIVSRSTDCCGFGIDAVGLRTNAEGHGHTVRDPSEDASGVVRRVAMRPCSTMNESLLLAAPHSGRPEAPLRSRPP